MSEQLFAVAGQVLRQLDELNESLKILDRSMIWYPREGDENITTGGTVLVGATATETPFALNSAGKIFIRRIACPGISVQENYATLYYNGNATRFVVPFNVIQVEVNAIFNPGLLSLVLTNAIASDVQMQWAIEGFLRYPEIKENDHE